MLQSSSEKLKEYIVKILSIAPRQTSRQIQQQLIKQKKTSTIQGIYRVLRALHEAGVIIKEGQEYSLRIAWILDLADLSSTMEHTYLTHTYLAGILPTLDGQRKHWYFSTPLKMNSFCSQVLLAMVHGAHAPILLECVPHIWPDPFIPHLQGQFKKTLFSLLEQRYTVVGSRSYLDMTYTPQIIGQHANQYTYYVRSTEERIEKDPRTQLYVVDNYILTVHLSKKTVSHVEAVSSAMQQGDIVSLQDIERLSAIRGRSKISIRKDTKDAQLYRTKFERMFGPIRR